MTDAPRTIKIGDYLINVNQIAYVELNAELYVPGGKWLPAVRIYFAAPQGEFDGVHGTSGSIQPDSITFTDNLDKIREFLTAVMSPVATLDLAEKPG